MNIIVHTIVTNTGEATNVDCMNTIDEENGTIATDSDNANNQDNSNPSRLDFTTTTFRKMSLSMRLKTPSVNLEHHRAN